ncbi:MAG: CMP/dCMP kinase [Candidatus Sumerlaeota bacterium]|nr:CMP/dCMP kinase [Candidatus Sumerlaeota bacterium]
MASLPVVAIDGPVGVGKSSVARRIAERLGFLFLDTGAMYRAVTLKFLELPEHERTDERLAALGESLDIELANDGTVLLGGRDVTLDIRDERVSRAVAIAADSRAVREALVRKQRAIGSARPCVMEGRDITTVVFPDARWKFYLDASARVRAQRRVDQLQAMGKEASFASIHRDLVERDARDRAREWGALSIAADATVIDTTEMTEQQTIALICAIVAPA